MSDIYVDTGWTGDPEVITAAILANPLIVAIAGYQVLDGIAYVLVRGLQALPPPAGVSLAGPDLTRAVSGVFMADTNTPPANLSEVDLTFFGANTWQSSIA